LSVTLVLFRMVERMVFHGHGRTMSDDQVVMLLEEHGDTEAGGTQGARRRLWAGLCC